MHGADSVLVVNIATQAASIALAHASAQVQPYSAAIVSCVACLASAIIGFIGRHILGGGK